MLTVRWLVFSVVGLISLASVNLQSQPAIDKRVAALETSQAALVKRVTTLESAIKAQPTKAPLPTNTPQPSTSSEPFDVVSVDAKITDSRSGFDNYGWIVKVQSNSDKTFTLMITVDFMDKDGFIVAQDVAFNVALKPHEEATYTGARLIPSDASATITNLSAKAQVLSSE